MHIPSSSRFVSFVAALAAAMSIVSACHTDEKDLVNLAFNHPTYHSSAVNYDFTAQLATDGIIEEQEPVWYSATLNGKPYPKEKYAWFFDYRPYPFVEFEGSEQDLCVWFNGFGVESDKLIFLSVPEYDEGAEQTLDVDIMVSYDGSNWELMKNASTPDELGTFGRRWRRECEVSLDPAKPVKGFRFLSRASNVKLWTVATIEFYRNGSMLDIYNMIPFRSYWISDGCEDEWVYVDLGVKKRFERLAFYWLNRPVFGEILVSDDAVSWKRISRLKHMPDAHSAMDCINVRGNARYVKILCSSAADGGRIALSEMQVFGKKEDVSSVKDSSDWKLVRSDMADKPEAWVDAKVPCTVLAAYIDAGIVPDPAWADNNQQISDSYFKHDFIYRGTLPTPEKKGGHVYLNFDGINWKADVKFNGVPVGHIDGAFIRSRFDVTDLVRDGGNEVEVLVHPNANPSCGKGNTLERDAYNGGILGADNPTFHASVGWDWIPCVHGRNMGIWNDVYLSTSGAVTVENPFTDTKLNLPDTTLATVSVSAVLENHGTEAVETQWKGSVGDSGFEQTVELAPGQKKEVSAKLSIRNPRLWWPNGYGNPELYDVSMEAVCDGAVSDTRSFKTGLRQMTYSTEGGRLTMFINGRRFIGRGGNWGFSEYNLRYRAKEYDTAVRLHRDQNFTMIRNWVGQVMDDEFWEACDRYGIMVWQDFWLANPSDGPDPDDEKMFMANADDLLLRIRNHPSIALYVGRNEGVPPESLDKALRASIKLYHPAIFYIPDSSHGLVGGNGNYRRQSALEYFSMWNERPDAWGQNRIHSEKGMPNVPNFESFVKFMPENHWWPQDDMWGVHDWSMKSAQTVGTFNAAVESMFGGCKDAEEFCRLAQWVNYDGYRAMFECRSEQRRGLLLWMSHPAWPTFVWSTYDYWYDPTAAFYGCKKANEPLHVMWNPLKKVVEAVNYSAGDRNGIRVEGEVLDMYGTSLFDHQCSIDSREDSTVPCFGMETPDVDVYYYRLKLYDGSTLVSENFYVLGKETDNFKALNDLPWTRVSHSCESSLSDNVWKTVVTVENSSETPAMMIHLTLRNPEGERVLPVHYSDNYFHLMPGEKRTVTILADSEYCGDSAPEVTLEGFNLYTNN